MHSDFWIKVMIGTPVDGPLGSSLPSSNGSDGDKTIIDSLYTIRLRVAGFDVVEKNKGAARVFF
jgi:hypothetical protein